MMLTGANRWLVAQQNCRPQTDHTGTWTAKPQAVRWTAEETSRSAGTREWQAAAIRLGQGCTDRAQWPESSRRRRKAWDNRRNKGHLNRGKREQEGLQAPNRNPESSSRADHL